MNGQLSNYLSAYPALAAGLPGRSQPWLQTLRDHGLQAFSRQGFPGTSEEDWRYTRLSAPNGTLYEPMALQTVDPGWLEGYRLRDAWSVVLVNGRFAEHLSELAGLPEGVTVAGMQWALERNAAVVQNFLGKAVDHAEHNLVAFNNAWFGDGVFLDIAPGVVLAKPLQILHVVTENRALAATRNCWVVREGAAAELVETFAGSAADYFTASVNECFLERQAILQISKMQVEAENATHFGGTYLNQAEQSVFTHHNFGFGGLLARTDLRSNLGRSAECRLNGLYLGRKRQHFDNHTRINHLQPQGVSREYYKGVLDQRARGVFQGRVLVGADAGQTDSQMDNRNLLLSADAEVDTKPQLEIYADDVKCSHGVTVGQLEENSLFYLQSRGLDAADARNMLIFAFANEMLDKVANSELKEQLLEQCRQHFPAIRFHHGA